MFKHETGIECLPWRLESFFGSGGSFVVATYFCGTAQIVRGGSDWRVVEFFLFAVDGSATWGGAIKRSMPRVPKSSLPEKGSMGNSFARVLVFPRSIRSQVYILPRCITTMVECGLCRQGRSVKGHEACSMSASGLADYARHPLGSLCVVRKNHCDAYASK